jgi:hypothetical protein
VFCCASATACRFFLHIRLGFVYGFTSFSFYIFYSFSGFTFRFIYMFFDANCVSFSCASATTCCVCFSANCTGLFSTSATGTGSTRTAGNGYTATSQQADDPNSGKDLFQFLCVHGFILLK